MGLSSLIGENVDKRSALEEFYPPALFML